MNARMKWVWVVPVLAACGAADSRRKPTPGDDVDAASGGRQGAGGRASAGAPGSGGLAGGGGSLASGGQGGSGGAEGDASAGGSGGALLPDASSGGASGVPDASTDASTDAGPVRDLYVSPTTGSDTNDGTRGAPYLTMQKAFAEALPGDTVWLGDGTYLPAEPGYPFGNQRSVPAGVNLRAVNPLLAVIGVQLYFDAGGEHVVQDLTFDYNGGSGIRAATGTLTLRRLQFSRGGGPGSCTGAIWLEGDARATLDGGGDPNFTYNTGPVNGFASVFGSAELTMTGGRIDGASTPGCSPGATVVLRGSGKLAFHAVTMTGSATPYFLVDGRAELSLRDGTILEQPTVVSGPTPVFRGIWVGEGATTTRLTIADSTIRGPFAESIRLDTGTPTVELTNARIENTPGIGIVVPTTKVRGGVTTAAPSFTMTGSFIVNNAQGGICLNRGGTFTISASTVSGNGAASGNLDYHCGGFAFGGTTGPYTVSLRSTVVADNVDPTPFATFAGVYMQGASGSTFDLGTSASSGGNTLTGNAATAVRLAADAAVVVHATGNTWVSATQGTDAGGRFVLGQAPCGPALPCTVTTGSGANYVVTSGTLSLVE